MIDSAQLRVLVIDSSKLETRARFRSVPLSRFVVVVTELDPIDARLDPYRDLVARVL